MAESDQIPLSDDLLGVLRRAARKAVELREPFITPRTILLALLEDPSVGAAIGAVVSREKVLAARPDENFGVAQINDELSGGEIPAMVRYDTLAVKTPDGRASVWLSRDAHRIFMEGAQRAEERYVPKHLALGLAAEAVHAPGVLSAIRVEPGILADAIYKL